MDYFLQSERLGFRTWTLEDLSLARALWGDADVMGFLGGAWKDEAITARLATEISNQSAADVQYWPMFSLADGTHAGCAGLRPLDDEPNAYEVGVHLHRAFWGGQYGEEAARTVMQYAFKVMGAQSLMARHHARNLPSRDLIARLGFQRVEDSY